MAVPVEHAPRTYSSDGYLLPSDEQERGRLELQHHLLKLAFENRIVLAPLPSLKDISVLESGTGSGVWLLDLEKEIQGGQIHGIDIEPGLFPKEHAPNLSFSVASVIDLPHEWANQYTFVHQRLLIAGLSATEWKAAISEMYRVLAPGGYIQLCELRSWKAGPVTERHRALTQALYEYRGFMLDCATRIPHMLSEAGFIEVKEEARTIPLGKWAGETGVGGRDNLIGVFRGMKTPILRSGGFGHVGSEAEFDKFLDEVEEEWDETPGAGSEFVIVTAQKPE